MNNTSPAKFFSAPVIITILIVITGLAAGTVWFFHNFEKKEFEISGGMSPAAYNNPFLAAEKFFIKLGKEAESIRGLDLLTNLPPSSDAIFVARLPTGLPQSVNNSLLDWVEEGGHLLMVPNPLENENPNVTDLSQRIGVRFAKEPEESDCGCPENEDTQGDDLKTGQETGSTNQQAPSPADTKEPDEDTGYHPFKEIRELTVDGHKIRLEADSYRYLEDLTNSADFHIPASYIREYINEEDQDRTDNKKLIEQGNNWLLQYRKGLGTITVFSDTEFITNHRIAEQEHAFFLAHLVSGSNKVWLIYSSNVDSLLKIIWNKFPLFWISLLVSLSILIWMRQMQSGPKEKLVEGNPQSVLTHIDATGNYFWRTDGCQSIVNANRKHFLQWWQVRNQGVHENSELSPPNLSRLSERTGIAEEEFQSAFQLNYKTELEFIHSSQALQKISLALHAGEKKHND